MPEASQINYRKIDVDAYDEDQFVEDEELMLAKNSADDETGASSARLVANVTNVDLRPKRNPDEILAAVDGAQQEIRSLLSKGNVKDALKSALAVHPNGSDPQEAKEKHTQTVMDVLAAVKSNDIPVQVKQLSVDELDILMKYVYRGMETPNKFNPAILLAWHERAFEVAGLGSVVRVMTDRKTV